VQEPHWAGHAPHIAAYWRAWELAFANLQKVHRGNGFVAPYIDTAFNDCLFAWDSVFILHFGRYGQRAFDFQRTLDNLYAKQHSDGFISREVREWSGVDQFHRHDPASTGPEVFAWSEWEFYLNFADRERLRKVFPVLLAYHRWLRRHRTWPDGSYFSCGLACGMDNQPRVLPGYHSLLHHSYQAWIDACAQALISARLLVLMAVELGHASRVAAAAGAGAGAAAGTPAAPATARFQPVAGSRYAAEVAACIHECGLLSAYIQEHMWDDKAKRYADRRLRTEGGAPVLSPVKTIGTYWTLLADTVTAERLPAFLDHLENPAEFNRPVRPPSLAASDPSYHAKGGYWLGGVWPPTVYMVLRGLTHVGADDLAADIGRNFNESVARCCAATGTVWENMAPEHASLRTPSGAVVKGPVPGEPAKGDFCGWGGLGPITVLLEYVFGLRADVPASTLVWDIRLLDAFGVRRYPFGVHGSLDVEVASRGSFDEPPRIKVRSNVPVRLVLRWGRRSVADGGFRPERSGVLMEEVLHVGPPLGAAPASPGAAAGAGASGSASVPAGAEVETEHTAGSAAAQTSGDVAVPAMPADSASAAAAETAADSSAP